MRMCPVLSAAALLSMAMASGCVPADGGVTLHVAPDGDDSATGTASAPLRSMAGARDRLRAMRRDPAWKSGRRVRVVFADGVYRIDSTVLFSQEDSGDAQACVVYEAEHRGKAVFDGGVALEWRAPGGDDACLKLVPAAVRAEVKVSDVPASVRLPGFGGGRCFGNEHPAMLYAEGAALPVAAWPDAAKSWSGLAREFAKSPYDASLAEANGKEGESLMRFRADPARAARWAGEPDLWAYGLWKFEWDDSYAKVVSVDASRGILAVPRKSVEYVMGERCLYRVVNAFSELDSPGEWAIDRARRRIYLLPGGGFRSPELSSAMSLLSAESLHDVVFDGFEFRHCRGEAVSLNGCCNVVLRGSRVCAVGGYAVEVNGGSCCRIEGCDISGVGEGGIVMSGGDRATLEPARHLAENNHVHHWGERIALYRSAIGFGGANIMADRPAVGCSVRNNLIHHGRHLAVFLKGNDDYVGWNVIHDVCAFTRDAGAIYGYTERDWSAGRGCVVEHNCLHSIGRIGAGDMIYSIYNDGFLSGVTVRGNIVVTGDIGLFQNGGQANVYDGNIVVCCLKAAVRNNLGGKHHAANGQDSVLWRNLQREKALFSSGPWAVRFPELSRQAAMTNVLVAQSAIFTAVSNNAYVCCGDPVYADDEEIRGLNVVTNNIAISHDPGFVDFSGFDWRLREDAPVRPVTGDPHFERMGLFASPARLSPPVKFGEGAHPVPELKVPRSAAVVRIDVECEGQSFTNGTPVATSLVGCRVPEWSKGRNRICSFVSDAENGAWREYSMSFVPSVSGDFRVFLMGSHGRKTAVDDLRAAGADMVNGGFEDDGGWTGPVPSPGAEGRSDVSRPYGIVGNVGPNVAPEGKRMAVVNHDLIMSQTVRLSAGVPFTLRWRASAFLR